MNNICNLWRASNALDNSDKFAGFPSILNNICTRWPGIKKIETMTSTQKLPPELADVFEELDQPISSLHANWLIFEQLFATSKERVDLLNEFAPIFFRLCQDLFWDSVILSIGRLTDPQKSAGKDTLTLEQLISKVDLAKYPDLRDSLNDQLTSLKTYCQPLRDIRNRTLAHNDLSVALKSNPNPLPDILS